MLRVRGFGTAVLAVMLISAGCSSSVSIPAPTSTGQASAGPTVSTGPTDTPAPTPSPTPTASPTPVPVPAQWVSAGTIDPGRSITHAVLLTGGDVLVVGEEWTGCTEGLGALDTTHFAEVYRTATGTWQKTASLNQFRWGMVAVPLANNRALVTAGLTDNSWSFSSAKIYDLVTGKWTQPGLMLAARTQPAAATLKDGRVIVAGGRYEKPSATRMLATAEIFDPATGKWKATGALHTARANARAVTLLDGRVLVVGGETDVAGTPTATAEIWDPATGKWSGAGSLAKVRGQFRTGFSLVPLRDGSALVVGGTAAATTSAERFNPTALTWSSAGTMVTNASNRTAVVLADGRVLVAGGLLPGDHPIAAAELFDPVAGTWTATVPLPKPRGDGAGVLLADGSVLLAGGNAGAIKPTGGATGGGYGCPSLMPAALRYIPPVP